MKLLEERIKKEGKFLNNGKVVITRNGKSYNIHGIEIK